MDLPHSLTRPSDVRAYLRAINFSPGKSLGQNFLVDANIRDLILDASEITRHDRVIEVGPGLGVMTQGLLQRAQHVLAIELDARLHAHLQQFFADVPRLTLRHADAVKTNWPAETARGSVRVVSNLPYSAGGRILHDLAAPDCLAQSVTVMLQRDVADRLLAPPGGAAYGHLTVRVQWAYHVQRVRNVPGACFLPPPRVDSTVVHLRRRLAPPLPLHDPDAFAALVKFAFTRRRKQLRAILRERGPLPHNPPVDLTRRPETLSPEDWARLANTLSAPPQGR